MNNWSAVYHLKELEKKIPGERKKAIKFLRKLAEASAELDDLIQNPVYDETWDRKIALTNEEKEALLTVKKILCNVP